MVGDILKSQLHQLLRFGRRQTLLGRTECASLSRLYLYENEHLVVARDQIDLAQTAAPVMFDDRETVRFELEGGDVLPPPAELLP